MSLRNCFLIVALLSGSAAFSQSSLSKDTVTVNTLLAQSKSLAGSDSAKAIDLALRAKKMAEELDYSKGEALALKNMGMVYYGRGIYGQTLEYWNQALVIFEKMKDDVGIANMVGNIGAIYFNQGADDKALEYSLRSLQLAEKIGDTTRMILVLSNIGGIYHDKHDSVALTYLLKAVALAERIGATETYIGLTGNVGEIYFDSNNYDEAFQYYSKSINAAKQIKDTSGAAYAYNGIGKLYLKEGNFDLALQNHNTALKMADDIDDKLQVIRSLKGIGDVYEKKDNILLALEYYKRARAIAEQMDDVKVELTDLYSDLSNAYAKNKDFSNAYTFKSLYSDFKDTLYNIANKKKLNQLQFDFELSKKEQELVLKEAKIKSEKQARIGVTIGLGLLLIIIFIVYRNYLQKAKTNNILDKQKAQIEDLLHNILPKQVASELQASGKSKPRHFEQVSVLFTDFKGFTAIADKLSPEEVVHELNECFMAFDSIMEKYNLEKIKTIGDAYMCAGNLPLRDPHHAYNIIRAALEIQAFMSMYNTRRAAHGLETWEIRIGVHIGPVVAGVVGKKKYAYDIWGSTVNIASRMESNCTPGRVNISADTYEQVKEHFECSNRGKIYAKNLGELEMYFVEHEKPMPAIHPIHKDKEIQYQA